MSSSNNNRSVPAVNIPQPRGVVNKKEQSAATPAKAASPAATKKEAAQQRPKTAAGSPGSKSPAALSPSGSSLMRSTRASESFVLKDDSAAKVGIPEHVEQIAKQSPTDRVRSEFRETRELKRSHSACAPSRGFGSSARRLTFTAEKAEDSVNLNSPRRGAKHRGLSPARAAARRRADDRLATAKTNPAKQDDSAWARSKVGGNRHSFQRKFPLKGFPATAADATAPGPGAYGASTSYGTTLVR